MSDRARGTVTSYKKLDRAVGYGVGAVILLAAFLSYQAARYLGFPDGFLTELDRAERVLLRIFAGTSVVAGLASILLGHFCHPTSRRRLYGVLLTYGVVAAALYSLDLYYRQHLSVLG